MISIVHDFQNDFYMEVSRNRNSGTIVYFNWKIVIL